MKKLNAKQVEQVNAMVNLAARALKELAYVCHKNGSPLKGVSFKVLKNGDTRMHIDYR